MAEYFYCRHCKRRTKKNPCLKSRQYYCGYRECQQARKNTWERQKLNSDPGYNKKRKEQKASWRATHPSHAYQRQYRETHPDYLKKNRMLQKTRNKDQKASPGLSESPKIVKTDSLTPVRLIEPGLYEIRPYKIQSGKKIVNTDALIVALSLHSGIQEGLAGNHAQL